MRKKAAVAIWVIIAIIAIMGFGEDGWRFLREGDAWNVMTFWAVLALTLRLWK